MGRKLPGKRHRQVKDPYEINKRKDAGKQLNKKPGNPDNQELPRALREIMRFTQSLKSDPKKVNASKDEKKKRKRHWRDSDDECEDKPTKGQPKAKRLLDTNMQVMQNKKLVEKYKASVDYDFTHGSKKSKRKGKEMDGSNSEDEEDEEDGRKKKTKKKKSKINVEAVQEQKLRKENNKKLRLQKLKRKKNRRLKKLLALETEVGDNLTDQVNFGEVVHNPPTLTARPKGTDVRKAGRRTLLLKDMMLAGKIRLKNNK